MSNSAGSMTAISPRTSTAADRPQRPKTMNFGQFYQRSYLDMNGNVIKKGSVSSPNLQPPASFHRPDNFSYNKEVPKYGKTKKAGMLDLLRGGSSPRAVKSAERRSRSSDSGKSPERSADTEAIIKLSHYPSAELRKDIEPAIEREDWPAPPAMAVITKNLVKSTLSRNTDKGSSDEEEVNDADFKIQKELDSISKIQDSAMVNCIREDLTEQIKQDKKRLLDPRSASRTPSASKEPVQPTRFTSPFNASPSRSLVERPRFISESGTKTTNQNKTDPPVVHGATTAHRYRVKPGYSFGYVSKSLSTVPPGTPGAYVYDSFNNLSSDEDEDLGIRELERKMHVVDLVVRNTGEDDDRDSVFERGASQRCSTMSDSVVFLKHLTVKKSSTCPSHTSSFDGSPFLNAINFDYKKRSESVLSLWEELLFEPEETIPYSEINLSSTNMRKGLSKSNLEKYLSNEEFEQHLGATREEFYKMPEFKRNDIKKKANLF